MPAAQTDGLGHVLSQEFDEFQTPKLGNGPPSDFPKTGPCRETGKAHNDTEENSVNRLLGEVMGMIPEGVC